MQSIRESNAVAVNGFLALLVFLALLGGGVYLLVQNAMAMDVNHPDPFAVGVPVAVLLGSLFLTGGFFIVQPNEAKVLVFLGRYVGSIRKAGFFWANPFAARQTVSLRVRNFNSDTLKVNDSRGNPIEIATVVVWRVTDSARALFDVEKYTGFVAIQTETAIRNVATQYPYDPHQDEVSLRGNTDVVSKALCDEIQERLEVAGVEVIEARLSHLAYATEIAQAMLRRQQAQAIVAARREIVEGAVGMVKMGIDQLTEYGVVDLDNERKAMMVNNLLVALVADSEAQPVINTGTVY